MNIKWYCQNGPQGDVVLSSCIRLSRNLKNCPFPCRLTSEQMNEVCEKVREVLDNYSKAKLYYIRMADLTANRVVSPAEKHLISPAFAEIAPGKALMLSENEDISIMLCEDDHVRIQAARAGFALDEAYQAADAIDDHLSQRLEIAFDERLGYLTQHPTKLGTAMRASVMLHLPALTQNFEISRLSATVAKLGLKLRGPYDDGGVKGDVYRLSNQLTLGISEKTAIDNLKSVTLQIATRERAAREALQANINYMDKIHRAYGILCSARVVTSEEMNEMLSYIRVGAVFGELPVQLDTVNELSATLQPATMNADYGEDLNAAERDAKRADVIKRRLAEDAARKT